MPDKHESAGRGHRAAVAAVVPLLLPRDLVGLHVHRGECASQDATVGRVEGAAEKVFPACDLGWIVFGLATGEDRNRFGRADIQVTSLRVVARGRPVRSPDRARCGDYTPLPPKRREDLAFVHVVPLWPAEVGLAACRLCGSGTRRVQPRGFLRRDRLRSECVAHRERLRRRGVLARLLRDCPFVDSDQRLAVCPIEDVDPSRLARFRQCVPHLAIDLYVEEDDRGG